MLIFKEEESTHLKGWPKASRIGSRQPEINKNKKNWAVIRSTSFEKVQDRTTHS